MRRADGKSAGAALVLGSDTVLTCAHVVNDALGRALFDPRTPRLHEVFVTLDTPQGIERYPARVAHWVAPRTRDGEVVRDGDTEWLGDLAVLRVDAPPGSVPAPEARIAMSVGQKVRAWHGSGHTATFADLTVTALDGPVAYLDGMATGMAIGPGYSGGPLWCEQDGAVVGLVAAHFMPPCAPGSDTALPHSPQHLIRRSWGIPWQRVEDELRRLGALDNEDAALDDLDGPDYFAMRELVNAIEKALPPYTRGEIARQLARECGVGYGSAVTPPTTGELAAFLLTHPRALAAISEILRPRDSATTDRMLTVGRFSHIPLLLSPRERRHLHQLLRRLEPAVRLRFPEAVREATKRVAVPVDGDTLDVLLDQLEQRSGDGHSGNDALRVPVLLRVVEYIGALCPKPRQSDLRLWSDGVAARLGIPLSALHERRSDAEDWVRSVGNRPRHVRVLAQVTRAERGRHRLRIWCDEGTGPRQVSTDSSASYSASEVARELLRVLDTVAPTAENAGRPLVEVLVDRTGLNLPVDEWEARDPDQVVPGVLGVEFPLVVHCPELLHRNGRFLPDWQRRCQQLESGETLVVSGPSPDPHQIYYQLLGRLDTVRVAVDVPPGPRDAVVQMCLAVGIPVVVWDRGPDTDSHVVKHMAQLAIPELPDGVRVYRANARAHPSEFPGRPVLAWADANCAVPRLQLTEPQESA
ncbi:putative uncharacterized protein [Streptomyces azureus]|uniref:vWA-MoxR associated protein C-terminal domain-containing protein n=1 Tax=Streptomyces azureus TaxID=146537 RepID=A0A0K8PKW5_STRAJ|nr:putative uncharacterized protein [Streptomyces azureus]